MLQYHVASDYLFSLFLYPLFVVMLKFSSVSVLRGSVCCRVNKILLALATHSLPPIVCEYFPNTATTQLGVWLFRDFHGVSDAVSDLTRTALLIMCTYPLFDAVVSFFL